MDQVKVRQTVRRMTEARASLIRDNPFFGHLSMRLQLACAPCETACTDGNRLIFDPEFAARLSEQELQFVTLHEVLHCVLEHCIRGKNLESRLYNIACDIVVNPTILDMWGLDNFKIDGIEVMHLAPDGKEGRLYNAEEIYHSLLQSHDTMKKQGSDDFENGMGNDVLSSFDRHDLWKGISDKTQLRDDWNGKIRNAIKNCGDSAGMPQSIRRVVYELADRTSLNWKQLLHDFLQFDEYDYTYIPPDRRYVGEDIYLPAFNINEDDGSAHSIWVCVDTSGSISEKELACAMCEILDAMRQAGLKGKISFFDSNITEAEPFEDETEIKKLTVTGGGGTSFHIIFEYLKEKMYPELPKAILIFTDGYAWWPNEKDAMDVPVLWLISKEGVETDHIPWGRSVKF